MLHKIILEKYRSYERITLLNINHFQQIIDTSETY